MQYAIIEFIPSVQRYTWRLVGATSIEECFNHIPFTLEWVEADGRLFITPDIKGILDDQENLRTLCLSECFYEIRKNTD